MAWLTNWTYRKEITVTNSNADYQTKVLVGESSGATGEEVDCGGHVAADFDDLRFTAADGTTLLDYWIESITGSTPNGLATVWVQNNATPDTTLYMYYGGTETAVSDGEATFLFFDDFSGDLTKWTTIAGTPSIAGGKLSLDSGEKTRSDGTYGATCAIHFTLQNPTTVYAAAGGDSSGLGTFPTNSHSAAVLQYTDSHWYSHTVGGAAIEQVDRGTYADQQYKYELRIISATSVEFLRDGASIATHTTSKPAAAMYMACSSFSGTGTTTVDDVFIRKYLATEPSFAWGSEETSGWTNISHVKGIAAASISHKKGIAVASISHVKGVAV